MSDANGKGRLEDRRAAEDLLRTYAASLDDGDIDTYRTVFAEKVEIHGFGPEPYTDLDIWVKFVTETLSMYTATQHMLGPQLTRFEGNDAHMRTDLCATHFCKEPAGAIFTLFGTYRTVAREIDGAWKIVRHELTIRGMKQTQP